MFCGLQHCAQRGLCGIMLTNNTKSVDSSDLQEWIRDFANIHFMIVAFFARVNQHLAEQINTTLKRLWSHHGSISFTNRNQQQTRRVIHGWSMSTCQKRWNLCSKHITQIRNFSHNSTRNKRRFLHNVIVRLIHQQRNIRLQITEHFGRRHITKYRQCKSNNRRVFLIQIHLQGVRNEHENLCVFIQQYRQSQISHAFVREFMRCSQFQTLNLTKICWIPIHVKEYQLLYVPTTERSVPFSEQIPNMSAFFLYKSTFFFNCLTFPILFDHIFQWFTNICSFCLGNDFTCLFVQLPCFLLHTLSQ
mmetsp:Transcript_12034/g.21776  ORF Transcript_12034/g.21776 Transcript_12034/m.21776 type:complete len:304 (-) Transcript_12034:26-937(-)